MTKRFAKVIRDDFFQAIDKLNGREFVDRSTVWVKFPDNKILKKVVRVHKFQTKEQVDMTAIPDTAFHSEAFVTFQVHGIDVEIPLYHKKIRVSR